MKLLIKNTFVWLVVLLLFNGELKSQQALTQAKALANETVNMMGGMDNYNATQFIGWNFFGKRQLLWDKQNNLVRVDLLNKSISIIASLSDETCLLYMDGKQVNDPDSLSKYLEKARLYWMNDSYWLLMPFKLFEDGVLISYAGRGETADGRKAEILELTYDNVGATPKNKYLIYIDFETRLISQWDYFENVNDNKPAISNAWTDYNWYGKILLASGRGDVGSITNIHVWENVPEKIFEQAGMLDFDFIK